MRERELFDTLCNTGDGVFIVDANKHIIRWNKGSEKILGYSEAEVLNRNCFQVILGKMSPDKPFCSQNCKFHTSALKGVPQDNFDVLTQASSGEPLWLNVTLLSPSDSAEPFVAHIVRDVTREKKKVLALDHFLSDLEPAGTASKDVPAERLANRYPPARATASEKPAAALSSREIEVLTLLAEGLSTKGLAQKLNISHFTARNHIQNILVKLNLHSKAQAVSYAFKRGIL